MIRKESKTKSITSAVFGICSNVRAVAKLFVNQLHFSVAKNMKSWHFRSSSYERTPKIGEF